MSKEGQSSREKDAEKLNNIRNKLGELAVEAKKGDSKAMQRSAHLASAAAKISARIGQYEEAGNYYKYGADMLKYASGAGYVEDKGLMAAFYRKSDNMFRMHDKQRAGKRMRLEDHAEAAAGVGNYQGTVVTILIGVMLMGAFIMMIPNITGLVTGELAQKISSVFAMCLFVLGLVLFYIYLYRRRK